MNRQNPFSPTRRPLSRSPDSLFETLRDTSAETSETEANDRNKKQTNETIIQKISYETKINKNKTTKQYYKKTRNKTEQKRQQNNTTKKINFETKINQRNTTKNKLRSKNKQR